MRQPARTIAIVGPDGSGKTTQAKLLVEHLQAIGYDAHYVHALYYLSDTIPCADRLRRQLGPRKTQTHGPSTSRLLYLLRRVLFAVVGFWFALVTIGVVSIRFHDQVVVFDRYYHQFFYDVYGPSGVFLSCLLPQPGRVIYLDADLATIQLRMDTTDRAVDTEYYATVIEFYDECSTEGWLSFCAKLPRESLHDRIFEAISYGLD
ncbi:hypothetical protein [Haloprofundus sp. SEDH52]|uniref:hypothetical protein n=1 Tax=Haloprofundus halobius TaxID=2876194 RepID=UPI001CD0140A